MTNQDYLTMSADIANVLCTGNAGKMLAALPEPWDDEPIPSPIPAELPAPPLRNSFLGSIPLDDDDEDATSEISLWNFSQQREGDERIPFQPWEEIISRIKAKEFHTQQALALFYKKSELWVRQLRALAVKQKVFRDTEEWCSYFPKTKRQKNKGTSRAMGGAAPLSRSEQSRNSKAAQVAALWSIAACEQRERGRSRRALQQQQK